MQSFGSGSGTVTSAPEGISCGETCSESFPRGNTVTLTAKADNGSAFQGWSGGGCSGIGECAVVMNEDKIVVANFEPVTTYPLTVSLFGAGSGTVTSDPQGISCGNDCSEEFNVNATVTLTASAATGSAFQGWSGEGCTGTGTCTVTMSQARSVTANFETVPTHSLTVFRFGAGTGTVTSAPEGIDCGNDCSREFNEGTSVTLTTSADTGSGFKGWSGGGCSGTAPCIVTMDQTQAVARDFRTRGHVYLDRDQGWGQIRNRDQRSPRDRLRIHLPGRIFRKYHRDLDRDPGVRGRA